jgi:diguanylate cyclase (GGDEF)-like protein/PAS domain S-box-containing protein
MLRVYACLAVQHDHRLVLLAGTICAFACALALLIVQRSASVRGGDRRRWLILAALATGLGIWSTHFIAMLAYEPNLPTGYDIPLTLTSILAAVVVTGFGWAAELHTKRRSWSPLPAAILAAGIGTMHYIGMQALRVQGQLIWDHGFVAASLAVGFVLATAALYARRRLRKFAVPAAALLLTLAICGLHFMAMAAATILPNPNIEVPVNTMAPGILAVLVGAAALILLAIGGMHVWFDRQITLRRLAEQQRVEDFANAAIEGLAVVEQGRIVDANAAFRQLVRWESSQAQILADILPQLAEEWSLEQLLQSGQTCEFLLSAIDGEAIDVEVTARPISWRGKPHTVLAVADIRTRKAAEARIRHLAFHDPLTGIANRTLFLSSLDEAVANREVRGGELAVLCFDLDRFKVINDVYGHAIGDELLRHVAHQIRECCDQDAVAARLGGDEFALIYCAPDAATGSSSLARRLLARLNRPVTLSNHSIRPSASVGIALIPRDASDAATAMRHADLALYRAKADGRGSYRFFEPAMDAVARARAELEADLRAAIAGGELFLHYQPLAGLQSGKIEGFEALVRWQHPTRGLILPDEFIPVAEDSGLIVELGEWVLNRACADAAEWKPPLRLSVNVSPAQFVYADVCATVADVLQRTGLPPDRLELEITEGVLIADPARGLALLKRIRATGVQIVMDDFGTGYSSLSYFRQFPFDKVKIDRSFVQDMLHNNHARSIVEAIISLGRGLNLQVVAEGVETAEQLAELQTQGCGQAQGYYISRPMAISQFEGSVLRGADAGETATARSA